MSESSGLESKDLDVHQGMEIIVNGILHSKLPCLSRTAVVKSIRNVRRISQRRADSEFWGLFKNLTTESQNSVPLEKKLGMMKIGAMEYYYPLEMIRIYLLTKKLASFPAVIFYLMEDDALADDFAHHYFLESWRYIITENESAYTGELNGVKISESPNEEFIPVKLTGHSPTPEKTPALVVDSFEINGRSADEFPKAIIVDETPSKKVYHIKPEPELALGDKFRLKLRCNWPGQLTSALSYVFTPCIHLRKGVDKEITEITSDRPLKIKQVHKFDMCSGDFDPFPRLANRLRRQNPERMSLKIPNQKSNEVYLISFLT